MDHIKFKCGKGYGSNYDNICRFCREKLFSMSDEKSVNVRFRGEGMSITQYRVFIGEFKISEVYI